jgi:hypothetical protein
VLAVFDEVADIQNVDDIRVAELGEKAPFLLKEVDGSGVYISLQGFDGYEALRDTVERFVDHTHSALADG